MVWLRWSLLGTPAPAVSRVVYSAAVTLAVCTAGAWIFRRIEQTFADEI